MGWAGKIVGGMLGATVGGPIGAVVGAALGSLFDKNLIEVICPFCNKNVKIPREGYYQCPYCNNYFTYGKKFESDSKKNVDLFVIYYGAIFAIAGKLAKADGVVTQDEIDKVDEFIKEAIGSNVEERKFAISIFNAAKDNNVPVEEYLYQFSEIAEPYSCGAVVSFLVALSLADGKLSNSELDILLTAEKIFQLPQGFVKGTLKQYGWYGHVGNIDVKELLKQHYDVLGIDEYATNDEVKRAYRQKVKEFHPDKILSKGLPDEFIKFASERFNEIQGAYEAIKNSRNM